MEDWMNDQEETEAMNRLQLKIDKSHEKLLSLFDRSLDTMAVIKTLLLNQRKPHQQNGDSVTVTAGHFQSSHKNSQCVWFENEEEEPEPENVDIVKVAFKEPPSQSIDILQEEGHPLVVNSESEVTALLEQNEGSDEKVHEDEGLIPNLSLTIEAPTFVAPVEVLFSKHSNRWIGDGSTEKSLVEERRVNNDDSFMTVAFKSTVPSSSPKLYPPPEPPDWNAAPTLARHLFLSHTTSKHCTAAQNPGIVPFGKSLTVSIGFPGGGAPDSILYTKAKTLLLLDDHHVFVKMPLSNCMYMIKSMLSSKWGHNVICRFFLFYPKANSSTTKTVNRSALYLVNGSTYTKFSCQLGVGFAIDTTTQL